MVADIALDIIGLAFQTGYLFCQEVEPFAFLADMTNNGFSEKPGAFFDLVGVLLQIFKRRSVKQRAD